MRARSPENWARLTVDQIKAQSDTAIAIGPFGSRMKANVYVNQGIPVIRGTNISDTKAFTREFVYISREMAQELRSSNVFEGDLVFPHRGSIGTVGIITGGRDAHYVLSSSLMKLTPNRELVDPLFIFYYFRSDIGKHELLKNASQVGTPGIATPLASLKSLQVCVPPLSEQRAIAHILGSLDDKIELNRKMNATLEEMARAVFRQWFVESEEVRNWELGKIKDVCEKVENGGTPRRDQQEYWEPSTIPWLTSGEVRQDIIISTENKISEIGYKNSSAKMWGKGTTVIALYGATAGQVSFIAQELCANQAFCGLIPNAGREYFVYLTLSATENSLASLARGSAQQNLSQQIVANFRIRKPDEKRLEEFNEISAPLFDKWITNLKESHTLAALRDTLLPKLMRGEVRAGVKRP